MGLLSFFLSQNCLEAMRPSLQSRSGLITEEPSVSSFEQRLVLCSLLCTAPYTPSSKDPVLESVEKRALVSRSFSAMRRGGGRLDNKPWWSLFGRGQWPASQSLKNQLSCCSSAGRQQERAMMWQSGALRQLITLPSMSCKLRAH